MGKTRGVHETTPELRNRMVGMYEAGLGLRDIAAAVNCSQRTVKRWLNRFDKEGTVETRERCGRKRATTTEEDDAIIRLATQTPITAAKAVLPALGLTCSVDTIRERLHKAGIHNWSPSRKHMQRLPLGSEGDSATIQQAVWRPTGTQLGKKKLVTKESNSRSRKTNASSGKKKNHSPRIRDAYEGDGASAAGDKQSVDSTEFVFPQQTMREQEVTPSLTQGTNDMRVTSESMSDNQTEYGNPLSLVQTSQSQVYQPHPELNVVQNWPLDLVQGSHHYPQGQPHAMTHEQPPPQQQLQELHTPRERERRIQQQQQQTRQRQMQSHHCDIEHQQAEQVPLDHRAQEESSCQLKVASTNNCPGKIRRTDSCSNSSSSNDRTSDMDELSRDDSRNDEEEFDERRKKGKKKGGKAKGTLETSVEIRNRMIGMSEAGLSTLSIALAINRSERTVKRWLERWNKEGNVQTKERKGRRRITTKEQDDAIIAMATQHPLTAAKHVAPALGLQCSVDTIRERLHKAGIHSWKLGKKQGEGNAVHTVHLWQPSGNRPNKPKLSGEKRKKSSEKKRLTSSNLPKRSSRRKKITEISAEKIAPQAPAMMETPVMQFQDSAPWPEMMQPVHDLSGAPIVSSPPGPPIPPSIAQTMQVMGPMMQQRSDCRMANSVVSSDQTNSSVVYPSCMVNASNNHSTHMDQPDPLNYEPYIWSF